MNQRSGPHRHATANPASTFRRIAWGTLGALLIALRLPAAEADPAEPDLTQLSIDELLQVEVPRVSGAAKYDQKITEAPSSVTVVTATDIKRYGHRTLADVLNSVQGFHVSSDRNYSFLGTRGVNLGDFNSRVLVLIDGHRLNNNLSDGAFIDTAFLLDVDLIDRVEVIRGPGSVLYGNNAFFGVINVITRTGKQLNGAEFSGEYAEFDTYKGRVTIGKQFTNGVQFLLSGTLYDSGGENRLYYSEFDDPAFNNGVVRNADDDAFGSFFGSVSYRYFTLQGGFISREKGNPTAQHVGPLGFNDRRLRTIDDRSYVNLKYAQSFPEVVDVTAQLYYDRSDYEIGYPVGPTLTKEMAVGEWWGAELQLNKRLCDLHTVTLGAEYRDDFRQERGDVESSRQSHGVYAQGDFVLGTTNLHLNAGVRYDQYGDFDSTFNPRVALIWDAFQTSTFKAIYGTAFRAPNFWELSDERFQDIRPEEITSYELVYEQQITRYLRSSLSGFFNEMDDLIVIQDGRFTNFNAETIGMEMALEGNWTNGIRSRLSYALQDTDNLTTDQSLADSPTHLFKASVSVPLYKDKVFAGLEYQFTSSRHTIYTVPTTAETLPGEDTKSFGIVNLTLFSQNLLKNLEFSATVYNLLDHSYGDPATRYHVQDIIPQNGRTYRLKLTWRF
jgi:outer membrane receptor for ferrienterochelin and colicins